MPLIDWKGSSVLGGCGREAGVGDWGLDSGRGGWGPETGFVPIWEFVAVHAFIMKLNEARKCLVGLGQNTASLMFPWQIWHAQEPVLDHKMSNWNTQRSNFWLTISIQAFLENFSWICQINLLYKNSLVTRYVSVALRAWSNSFRPEVFCPDVRDVVFSDEYD